MIITSKSYKIGTETGEYPEGDRITDSLIGMMGSIDAIAYNGSPCYTKEMGYIHDGDTLKTGNLLSNFTAGQYVTVFFSPAIRIEQA